MSASIVSIATRTAALARLDAFLPHAGRDYAEQRNHVRPPAHANVSGLSPWVQKRLILESEIIAAAQQLHGFSAAEKFIQEVYWRTYWKGWLEQRPEAYTRYRASLPRERDALSGERLSTYEAAITGRTDLACFNTWVHELLATGWLHNHARMWFASIWIFTLRLPWELGAGFFESHLLDGDAASNTLSWRWVAGLQTAGKTYLARADNIAKYQGDASAPLAHQLASEAVALREEPLTKIALPARPTRWKESLLASPAHRRLGLWLHPEDLCAERGSLADAPIAALFAAWPLTLPARTAWSPSVTGWTRTALDDGATRAAAHFRCPVRAGETEALADTLAQWSRDERLTTVLAYEPSVGPWRDEARAVAHALSVEGIPLIWIRRDWDSSLWPQAARGYFPFWESVKTRAGSAVGDTSPRNDSRSRAAPCE